MTNEEAIVRINYLIKLIKSPRTIISYCQDEMEALDLAIKALEEVEEWHKLKLICANEGIVVYKVRENDNEKV